MRMTKNTMFMFRTVRNVVPSIWPYRIIVTLATTCSGKAHGRPGETGELEHRALLLVSHETQAVVFQQTKAPTVHNRQWSDREFKEQSTSPQVICGEVLFQKQSLIYVA